jgi:integrase
VTSRPAKKPRRRAPSVRYGPGRYRPAPNGRGFDACICRRYRQIRARLPDEDSARAWIDAQETALRLSRPPLTRAQMLDAQDALAALPPGATLLRAARALAAASSLPAVPLPNAAARFLEGRRHGAVPLTVRGYRLALRALEAACGPAPVSAVIPAHVERALGGRRGVTRNNLLRHLATFFRWAVREGIAAGNPALAVPRARAPEPPRGILPVPQAAALMRLAEEKRPALVPYLALGLFAGIRPAELARLDPARIGREWIVIDGAVAKTADHRTVPVRPNLRAWLDAYPPARPIPPLSQKHLYGAVRALRLASLKLPDGASHIPSWPSDCMRHSYASYAYDLTRDAALVASEMGHRGTDIFFRHYRGLVAPGDGEKFFAIVPDSSTKVITR